MKEIPLTQGKKAIVDDEDYELLNSHKWHYTIRGYARRHIPSPDGRGQKTIYMHRLIVNIPEGKEVDHVNRDKLDNRKSNLRICTHSENQMNVKAKSNNSSGYKGVHWSSKYKKWIATIYKNGKQIYIGNFCDAETAAHAYDSAAEKLHGDFATLNY
jgi:hypothetical protein